MFKLVLLSKVNTRYTCTGFSKRFPTRESLNHDIKKHMDEKTDEINNKISKKIKPLEVYKTLTNQYIAVFTEDQKNGIDL